MNRLISKNEHENLISIIARYSNRAIICITLVVFYFGRLINETLCIIFIISGELSCYSLINICTTTICPTFYFRNCNMLRGSYRGIHVYVAILSRMCTLWHGPSDSQDTRTFYGEITSNSNNKEALQSSKLYSIPPYISSYVYFIYSTMNKHDSGTSLKGHLSLNHKLCAPYRTMHSNFLPLKRTTSL